MNNSRNNNMVNGKERLIKFAYNISLAYLNHKYKKLDFIENDVTSLEDLAVDITARFLKDNHSNLNEKDTQKHLSSNADMEYLIYKTITEMADKTMHFEMLKNDLITIEEYNSGLK